MVTTKLKCTMQSKSFYSAISIPLLKLSRLGSWFQFNDELVTRIDTLGDKSTQRSSKSKKDSAKERWSLHPRFTSAMC